MADFYVEDRGNFDHRKALIEMLQLLAALFRETWEDQNLLFPVGFTTDDAALDGALAQIGALIEAVARLERSEVELNDYGLIGDPLRFKLLVVAHANNQIGPARNRALERVSDGAGSEDRGFYRRTVKGALGAIDGPLESLTKLLGVNEGLVEFKKAIEVLLDLAP